MQPAESASVLSHDANGAVQVALVADDDPDMRGLLGRLVAATLGPYLVVEAADGAAALAEARRLVAIGQPPALLVTDVEMPGLDGVTLAAEVAAIVPDLRALLVSGRPLPPDAEARLGGVRHAFVAKPFHLSRILAAVAALTA